MAEIKLIVRTADRTKKAEISLSTSQSCADIIQTAVDNWQLPRDTDYTLVNDTKKKTLIASQSLEAAGIVEGDTLEIQPVLVAGFHAS